MGLYKDITEKFIMKNAWEDWASYREKLTQIIMDLKPTDIIIVGGGRCNDIDLGLLAANADTIKIIDVDKNGMNQAVNSLSDKLREKVDTSCLSLTGIEEGDMEEFFESMLIYSRTQARAMTNEGFKDFLMKELDILSDKLIRNEEDLIGRIAGHANLGGKGKGNSVLVCSGLHSQLFSPLSFFIRSLLFSLKDIIPGTDQIEAYVHKYIHNMNNQVIPIINSAFLKLAGHKIIFANEYMEESPVEGALQCINDVRARFDPKEMHLLWDFNPAQGVSYDMLIQLVDLKHI
ncbi:MAG: hypothetical protein K6E10_00630 [Eubacterium sp.]|nr:hypothetical protein [Eubacterium sp.]